MTISPPGGGGSKLRKLRVNKTKEARFPFPLPQFIKIGDTSNVGIMLITSWYKYRDTSPPSGHVIKLSRDRATRHYCSVLDKSWARSWNKYAERNRIQHSQLIKVKAVTPPQVVIESRIPKNINFF